MTTKTRRYGDTDQEYRRMDCCAVSAMTDKALLLELEDIGEAVWVPKSQVRDGDQLEVGENPRRVSVTRWWFEKQGWL